MEASFNSRAWLKRERRLLARAREGDRAAFGELYGAFAGPLYSRVLMPRLGNPTAAEDALAETFRTALERLDRFQDRGVSVWSWLCRIAINKAVDMHRVKQRTSRALANFEGLLRPIRQDSDSAEPERSVVRRLWLPRLKAAVEQTLARINPRYRRAIELRIFEERSRPECAEIMAVKVGTFDVVLLRSLRAFRREWEAGAGGGEGSA